jgi:hypothetical protein
MAIQRCKISAPMTRLLLQDSSRPAVASGRQVCCSSREFAAHTPVQRIRLQRPSPDSLRLTHWTLAEIERFLSQVLLSVKDVSCCDARFRSEFREPVGTVCFPAPGNGLHRKSARTRVFLC